MDDAAGEEEASMFETSHVLGALLASSPLLARAWDRCAAATAAASGLVHGEDGGTVYVGFSGVQAALSAAGAAVAGGGADAFAPVGLGGDATRRMFAALVANAEPAAAAVGEQVAVQALALQCFLKLCGSPDFQMLLDQIRGKAVVFTGHSLGGAIAALAALHYLCISSSSSTWGSAPSVLCVTFGSPLLGNEALSRAILRERWGGNFCHVVSQHDVVPRLLFCPLDAVPAHVIVGMQLQQWPAARTRHAGAVTAVTATARAADADRDALRQLVQTHVGAVAMDQKLADPAAPSGGPYRPFGTYVMCTPDGAVCVDNPTAAVQMLYATFASRCSPGSESPEAAHSCYGDLVVKMPQHLLLRRRPRADDDAPVIASNYDAGVSLALEASGIHAMVRAAHVRVSFCKRELHDLVHGNVMSDVLTTTAGDGGVDGEAVAEDVEACGAAAEPELRAAGDEAWSDHAAPGADRVVQGAVRRRDGVLRRVQAAAVAQEVRQSQHVPVQAWAVLGRRARHARRRPAPPRLPPPRQVGERRPFLPAPRRAARHRRLPPPQPPPDAGEVHDPRPGEAVRAVRQVVAGEGVHRRWRCRVVHVIGGEQEAAEQERRADAGPVLLGAGGGGEGADGERPERARRGGAGDDARGAAGVRELLPRAGGEQGGFHGRARAAVELHALGGGVEPAQAQG
ncbi:hypothetical protein SEVIR_8G066700v4 [Setaria viridis]